MAIGGSCPEAFHPCCKTSQSLWRLGVPLALIWKCLEAYQRQRDVVGDVPTQTAGSHSEGQGSSSGVPASDRKGSRSRVQICVLTDAIMVEDSE